MSHNGKVISYDGYVSLLYIAAQSYDTQFSTIIHFKGKKIIIYQHEFTPQEITEDYDHHVGTYIRNLIMK